MRRLLNTLYVTTQGAWLAKEGQSVVVKVEGECKLRVPLLSLSSIVVFGAVSVSPFLMAECADKGVGISYLSENGRFLARVQGAVSGNVLLRRKQYAIAEDTGKAAAIVQTLVGCKVSNQRRVLLRYLRDHGKDEQDAEGVKVAVLHLKEALKRLQRRSAIDQMRGIEGDTSKVYFSCFNSMLRNNDGFSFERRSRRPPMDAVNCLISFLYTLLVHDIRSALEGVGLDPQVGFLHLVRPGRPSLALDLMEEFRAPIADRLALSLINRQQVKAKGFIQDQAGGVTMDDDTRKQTLVSYQKRKQEKIMHRFIEEEVEVGLLFHVQALLFARFLRGDLDAYPSFFWR